MTQDDARKAIKTRLKVVDWYDNILQTRTWNRDFLSASTKRAMETLGCKT